MIGRRQALGLVLAFGVLLAGRGLRHRLLVGPDGAWRRELWLDGLLEAPDSRSADGDDAAAGTGPRAATVAAGMGAAGPAAAAGGGSDPAATGSAPGDAPRTAGRRPAAPGRRRATPEHPLAINTCSADSLQLLPGVGPVLASRIDEARRAGTIFRGPDDLLAVRGIGPATAARLAPLVRFAAPAPAASGPDNPH